MITDIVRKSSDEDLIQIFRNYEVKWSFEVKPESVIEIIKTTLDLNDLNNLEKSFGGINNIMISIGSEFKRRSLMDNKNNAALLIDYNRLLEKIHYAKQMMSDFISYERITDTHDYNANIDTTMFKFVPIVYEDLRPFQKLLFKMIDYLDRNEYRRVDDMCYEQIRVGDYGTHAWKPKCSIVDMVNSVCNMVTNFGNWALLTTAKEIDKQINDHLMRTKDPRFPVLVRDRHVFSFQNGIYFAHAADYTDRFVEYGSDEFARLDPNIVSCKYFDHDFAYVESGIFPEDIHTPVLDSVYTYQKLDQEIIVINKMLLGRMLYNVGELDNWQIIPFLLGAGGTGKSTINNIIRTFYENEDVGIMGNNYQKTFGLADIYDKFAFIAPEIKRDWGIDQAEFQEIVSGGKINVNIKHKPSVRIEWTAPGMLGGNENPGFVDNASSIQRRVVVTRFDRKVIHGDPQLGKKLEKEISAIMRQCNLYYLRYASMYSTKDIWNVLPDYFLETQRLMAAASNSLFAFLDSECLVFGEELYMPMDEFFKRFNAFCTENNLQKPKINVDLYRSPFAKYNLDVEPKASRKYPVKGGRMYKNATFVMGVDIKLEDFDF